MRQKYADEILNKVVDDYDSIAVEFDNTRNFPWYEFEIYRELLKKGETVLDLGCGNGRLYESLKDFNIKYVGIDVSKELLKKAQLKYRKKDGISSAVFKEGSFLSIPIKQRMFDKVYCVASFHHIPSRKYRLDALQNIKRVLKKDGTLIISVWNLWQPRYRKYIWKTLLNLHKYDFGDCFIPWSKSGVMRYYHAFSKSEMRSLFSDAGYYLVDDFMVKKGSITESVFEAENFIFIAKPIRNV